MLMLSFARRSAPATSPRLRSEHPPSYFYLLHVALVARVLALGGRSRRSFEPESQPLLPQDEARDPQESSSANHTSFFPPQYRIVLAAGQLVLRQGGVIRDIANWGTFTLPKPISRHEMRHTRGHYFVMRFDSSVRTQEEISRTLRLDPRMIRTSSVKLGDGKLETLSKFGKVPW